MSLFYALLVGIAMGALIQRVGASSPRMILASLRLENVAIMKFMATTIAVGTVVVYAMSYGKITLFGVLHLPPLVVAIALAALFIAGVTLLPTVPHRQLGHGVGKERAGTL